MSHDPRAVLEDLAESLAPEAVLGRFAGLGREGLQRILREAAARFSPPTAAPGPLAAPAPGEITGHIDGAARGNPGEAGAGVVLRDGSGRVVERIALYLGRTTNNTAEYRALLLALERARELGATRLRLFSDSELLVNQVNGRYRTQAPHLQQYVQEAIRLMRAIGQVDISHVRRERNVEADALANEAIDKHFSGRV